MFSQCFQIIPKLFTCNRWILVWWGGTDVLIPSLLLVCSFFFFFNSARPEGQRCRMGTLLSQPWLEAVCQYCALTNKNNGWRGAQTETKSRSALRHLVWGGGVGRGAVFQGWHGTGRGKSLLLSHDRHLLLKQTYNIHPHPEVDNKLFTSWN